MSFEIENQKTVVEMVDAASNVVEQMYMAHMIKDEDHFKRCHQKAGSLLFEALQKLQELGIE